MAIVGAAMQIAFWTIVIPTALWILIKLFGDFFYGIGTMLFNVMDMLQSTFRKLAGLGTVWVDGQESGDILSAIMKSSVVLDVLISVSVFALGLVILGSIVQIIRLEYTTEGSKNSKEKIFTTALKSLIMFILIPIVCFVGIRLSNYLLQAVDYATSSTGASTVSGSVFVASANSACKVYDENLLSNGADLADLLVSLFSPPEYNNAVLEKSGNKLSIKRLGNISALTTFSSTTGEITQADREKMTKLIGEAFTKVTIPSDEDAAKNGKLDVGLSLKDSNGNSLITEKTTLKLSSRLSYLSTVTVGYFYGTGNINYLLLYLGCYICIKALFSAAMGMIARIYKVVGLFVIAPAAIGLQPIDDGGAYKKWKSSFIQNVLSCYGFIVALNLYFMVVGVLQTVELWQGAGYFLLNSFMQFLFVLTGATMIKDLSGMFAGLIGAADAMADGEKAAGEVGKMASSVAKVGMGAAMGGVAAFKGLGTMMQKHKKVDVNGKKMSVASAQRREKALGKEQGIASKTAEESAKAFNDKYEEKEGKFFDKNGQELSGQALVEAQTAKRKMDHDADEVTRIKGERAKLATNENLGAQKLKVAQSSAATGMVMSRFTSMVGDSALAKTFGNMTGNIGDYISGKAYKGSDTAYMEKLTEKGIDVGKDGLDIKGLAGTTAISRFGNAAKGKAGIMSAEERAISDGQTVMTHIQNQAAVKSIEDAHEIARQEKDAAIDELRGKRKKVEDGMTELSSDHVGIESDQYTKLDDGTMRQLSDLIKQRDSFVSGTTSRDDFFNSVVASMGQQNIQGNAAIKDWLEEMAYTMTQFDSDNEARNAMTKSASINVQQADLVAKAHDSINDTALYGTYNEREEYASRKSLLEGIDKDISQTETAWNAQERAHKKNVELAALDPKAYTDAITQAVGDKFAKANNELAKKIEDLTKKLGQDGVKAIFGEDQKFKIQDQPILNALNKIKEATDKAAKEKADAAAAGETNKLLADMLKELKKKK